MAKQDLSHFKKTLNLSDYFISVIESLLTKLIDLGYIASFDKGKYINLLCDNISEVAIGSTDSLDYKTGFFDASQKKLYIKDDLNVPSCYLRLLYALCTDEISEGVFKTGFATTKMSKKNYKLEYENFGFNRGVIANLACNLADLFSYNITITPTHKTYTHNFLGYEIVSSNDIYAVEGKLISEFCFAFNIDEELLYAGLFTKNPKKYLEKIFSKKKFDKANTFIKLFDNFSRNYSTYNKLLFLSGKLNENYIEIKRNVLADDISNLKQEKLDIEEKIALTINGLDIDKKLKENITNSKEVDLFEEELTVNYSNLLEIIDNLELKLKQYIIDIQDILSEVIINTNKGLSSYQYASKLKRFNDVLICKNDNISNKILDTILFKLLPVGEITAMNITEKIKYSLILNILSERKFTEISNTFSFKIIPSLINEVEGTTLVLLSANKAFAKLIKINDLNKPITSLTKEPENIILDNLKYILNSDYSNMYCANIERLYTALRVKYDEFKNVSLDEIYIFEYENSAYMIVYDKSTPHLISYNFTKDNFDFTPINLSEDYLVFGKTKKDDFIFRSNLPTVYKKQEPKKNVKKK